jgi:hypothetical protein
MGTSEHCVQSYEAAAFLLDAVKDFIGLTWPWPRCVL